MRRDGIAEAVVIASAVLIAMPTLARCADNPAGYSSPASSTDDTAKASEVEIQQTATAKPADTSDGGLKGIEESAAGQAADDVESSTSQPVSAEREFPRLAAIPEKPPVPADNPISPAKIELGRLLFFDDRLSGDGGTSCATCHEPFLGWGDGNAISMGYEGTEHWRNSQTTVNTAYLVKLFWAGESPSLEAQAASAIEGNVAGNGDPVMIEERLCKSRNTFACLRKPLAWIGLPTR